MLLLETLRPKTQNYKSSKTPPNTLKNYGAKYEGYSKIKLRLAGKKNQNREQNFLIWNSYIPH
jgi:hypothetical protein